MTFPGSLFHPFEKLVTIQVLGKPFQVPENNSVLRCFQYLAQNGISYGRFCWNEDCQYCRVSYDLGEGTSVRKAISCKLMVEDGMRILDMANEIRYCLRDLNLSDEVKR
jgi:NADH dehydrogenase/NADH:ubiquinone oxidoreductase subunit G